MMDYIKPYLTYEGELERLPFFLVTFFVLPILSTIVVYLTKPIGLELVGAIASLALAIIGVFATLQRIRNVGWNPWLILLMLIPGVNLVFYILLVFKK